MDRIKRRGFLGFLVGMAAFSPLAFVLRKRKVEEKYTLPIHPSLSPGNQNLDVTVLLDGTIEVRHGRRRLSQVQRRQKDGWIRFDDLHRQGRTCALLRRVKPGELEVGFYAITHSRGHYSCGLYRREPMKFRSYV